jgi:hypothetical protein
MNAIILGGIEYVASKIIGFLVWLFATVANLMNAAALYQSQLPWVQNLKTDIETVAWTLLGLYIAYIAVTRYILWNEGTADLDGTVLNKAILRTVIYVALSGALATAVFQWGLDLAQVIAASPMIQAAQATNTLVQDLTNFASVSVGLALGLTLAVGLGVVLLLIAAIQMAIRAAELVIYVIGAPLVALGQLNADGGTWTAWWTNLVILSLSQAVTILAFKGFVGTTQVLTAAHTPAWLAQVAQETLPIGGFGPVALGLMETAVRMIFVVLLMVGWMVVAIRGPHLLRQWSYRTGVSGFGVWVGGNVGKSTLGIVGKKVGGSIGTFLNL